MTNPERIPRWFLPVKGDLKIGGHYQLEGSSGGRIEACTEPSSLAVTWEYDGSMSWLRVTLEPAETGTVLEVVHESPVDPPFWKQYGPAATGLGWDLDDAGPQPTSCGREKRSSRRMKTRFGVRLKVRCFVDRLQRHGLTPRSTTATRVEAAREAAERSADFYTPDGDSPK